MRYSLKQTCLLGGKSCGLFSLAARSRWRNSRLLVLGYHGISLHDEHEWEGALYLSPSTFRRRMESLKHNGCTVLALEEALRLMAMDRLPNRAVVLTFDERVSR